MADKLNTYKIGVDTYTQLIKCISNLPDTKINQKILENILVEPKITKSEEKLENLSDKTVSEILEEDISDTPNKSEVSVILEALEKTKEQKEKPKVEPPKINKTKLSNINLFNNNNYTIIEPPQLLRGKLNFPIMKGGVGMSKKEQIMKLLINCDTENILSDIMKFYYYNETDNGHHKILNGDDIINIMVSLIYNEFIESCLKISEIISKKYIETIPEMYKFNFIDKVKGDLEKEVPNYKHKLDILNQNVDQIKKLVYNNMANKQLGGNIDKTIEEKINKNIENISTFLKTQKIHKQKGGAISLNDMLNEINIFNAIPNPSKEEKRLIKDKANIWVVELLEQKLASKEIRDNQYNIARFYLKTPTTNPVINFINDNASMLTLEDDDRIKYNMPNEIKVEKLGNATRGNMTDKLKEYFNKKYQDLLELQNANLDSMKNPKPTSDIGKIKLILSQTGGSKLKLWQKCTEKYNLDKSRGMSINNTCGSRPLDNDNLSAEELEETCFTSKQYSIFLKKMVGYFKSIQKNVNDADIGLIQTDIETLKTIENRLIKNNALFNNYRKIQEIYPDKMSNNITLQHLQSIQDTNSQIVDQYGKVNNNIINTIKALEKYTELKEIEEDAKKYPNLEKTLTQSGGNFKSYMKFNTQHDIKHFVSRRYEEIRKELDNDNQNDK
jgi:hypothetical protein